MLVEGDGRDLTRLVIGLVGGGGVGASWRREGGQPSC